MNDERELFLKPACHRLAVSAARGPMTLAGFKKPRYLITECGLKEEREVVLKPVARRLVMALLERADTCDELWQAWDLVVAGELYDIGQETLGPITAEVVSRLARSAEDLDTLLKIRWLAEGRATGDVIEKEIRPAIRRAFVKAAAAKELPPEGKGVDGSSFSEARKAGMREAVPVVARVAAAPQVSAQCRAEALLVLTELAGRLAMPVLEGLLTDAAVVGECRVNNLPLQCQLRDVALMMLVRLTGQSLAGYGFPHYKVYPEPRGALKTDELISAAFIDDEGRMAALEKWRQWRAAQGK